jgi:hypothetical protein
MAACSAMGKTDDISSISRTLGISLSGETVLTSEDTHGGFHGDGETYAEISFDDESGASFAKNFADNRDWRTFPLSDNLQAVVYGNAYCAPYIQDDEGAALVPPIEQGYYYFYDRHSESKDPKDDTELFSRYSLNFTLALYDTGNYTLYYYELDT